MFIAAAFSLASCIMDKVELGGGGNDPASEVAEVEISIDTGPSAAATRADEPASKLPDSGGRENTIGTLDLLIFATGGNFLYHREAQLVSTTTATESVYKVKLIETTTALDVHFLANCHDKMALFYNENDDVDPTQLYWNEIHAMLYDDAPAAIVDEAKYLPMYGRLTGQTISTTTAPTRWNDKVELKRSVASLDVYVEELAATQRFTLQDLYVYRAASGGFLGELVEGVDQQVEYAPVITTGLDSEEDDPETEANEQTMRATPATTMTVEQGKTYDAIAYKMYVYPNPYTVTGDLAKRPTRIIVAGLWQTGEVYTRYYYPIDILDEETGDYMALARNHKYEFIITAVTGPGYKTLEEAQIGAPRNLNVEVIPWNKQEVQLGVKGHYYVTMEEKEVRLERYLGDSRQVSLGYEILDGFPAGLEMNFPAGGGTWTPTANGGVLENGFFRVDMVQTPDPERAGIGSVTFTVTALTTYNEANKASYTDKARVTFRDLFFEIDIYQLDSSDEDWGDGGDIPTYL